MGVACHGVSWAGHGIGVTEVVVAGMLSSVCVLFTLQSAFASGFSAAASCFSAFGGVVGLSAGSPRLASVSSSALSFSKAD